MNILTASDLRTLKSIMRLMYSVQLGDPAVHIMTQLILHLKATELAEVRNN